MVIDPPCQAGARRRHAWRAWALCGLLACGSASAELLTLTGLPEINQHDTPGHVHNPAFDRNAADGFQNGEFWCVPVATASVLFWLADHYQRPDVIPRDAAGQRYTSDAFVRYLGERWFNTNDRTGTGELRWYSALWGYLRDSTPYAWRMNVYAPAGSMPEIEGTSLYGHATVNDIYQEMLAGEDDAGAAVLMAYQHRNADGQLQKHAVAMQQLDNALDLAHRYPGKIMDPYYGRLDDVEFDAIAGLDTAASLWDGIAWRDVYLVLAIAPVPEPGALPLVAIALAALAVLRCARGALRWRLPAGEPGSARPAGKAVAGTLGVLLQHLPPACPRRPSPACQPAARQPVIGPLRRPRQSGHWSWSRR